MLDGFVAQLNSYKVFIKRQEDGDYGLFLPSAWAKQKNSILHRERMWSIVLLEITRVIYLIGAHLWNEANEGVDPQAIFPLFYLISPETSTEMGVLPMKIVFIPHLGWQELPAVKWYLLAFIKKWEWTQKGLLIAPLLSQTKPAIDMLRFPAIPNIRGSNCTERETSRK